MPKVLLVDDNADLLEVLGIYIRGAGIEVLDATSLAEVEALGPALDQVTLAILDVNLGYGRPSGIDVCTWLQAHHPNCRIVFLTGHASSHPLVKSASANGEVLGKPVDARRIIQLARGG
jgi:DNA-binding response OmpR family regulator